MAFPETRIAKTVATITLLSFFWVYLGLGEIAVASNDTAESGALSAQDKTENGPGITTAGSRTGKDKKKKDGFEDVLERMRKAEERTHKKIEKGEEIDEEEQEIEKQEAGIDQRDAEIRKRFRETEEKIKDLPEEIKQRHRDFVKKYEENYKTLKANIDNIKKTKTRSEKHEAHRKAKDFLEKVRSHKKHISFDPENLPNTAPQIKHPEVKERSPEKGSTELSGISNDGNYPQPLIANNSPLQVASAGSLGGLLSGSGATVNARALPTEADLSETIEVQFTPEIIAKAEELENKPVKLYEWIMNNFTYEPYYGSLKGAQQTLLERAGNDFDQASLLIALLRVSGIPARYVYGTIELPIERLMNWLGGIKDPNAAATVMATNGIPGTLITESGVIKYAQFEHVWVEAYVDMFPSMGAVNIEGDSWTPIDPSMKETISSESINISKTVLFDETTYISTADDKPPVLSYLDRLEEYYNTNFDQDFIEIFHAAIKKPQEFGIFLGTLPYEVISEQRYSEIPDVWRHTISLGLSSNGTDTVYVQKTYPEIAGKKIAISYTPASPNDQTIINSYGGLLQTPAYLVRVKPEIKLNDTTILTGPEIGLGTPMSLTISISSPNMSGLTKTADLTSGISYAIGLPALTFAGAQRVGQIDKLRILEGTLYDSLNMMDNRANELLQNVAVQYFGQLNNMSRLIESMMHIHNTKRLSIAVVSVEAEYDKVFDLPISPPLMKGMTIDAILVASSPVSIYGDTVQRKEFIKHRGLNSSYLEHKIIENLFDIEAISAVRALQIAATSGIPIYSINSTNVDSVLPLLNLDGEDKTMIVNAVNSGKEVIVSRDNVMFLDWSGVGYIVRDPSTGSGGYMISRSVSGGSSVRASNPAFDKEIKQAIFVSGQSHGFFDWLGFLLNDIHVWLMANISIWDGYVPIEVLGANKDLFLSYVNHPFNWIFYYIGHGGWKTDIEKAFISPARGDEIYPEEIKADNKIVFLNGCGLVNNEGFVSSFGIDGFHGNENREEVFLSWNDDIYPISAARGSGVTFWDSMEKGDTVANAVQRVNEMVKFKNYTNEEGRLPVLEYKGNGDTRLRP